MYLTWGGGGGTGFAPVLSTVPDAGLNHVGGRIRSAPSGPAYLSLSGAKVGRQSEPRAADTEVSELRREDKAGLMGGGVSLHLNLICLGFDRVEQFSSLNHKEYVGYVLHGGENSKPSWHVSRPS